MAEPEADVTYGELHERRRALIRKNEKVVAIDSALEIDLSEALIAIAAPEHRRELRRAMAEAQRFLIAAGS